MIARRVPDPLSLTFGATIGGNVTIGGTLAVTGAITATAGLRMPAAQYLNLDGTGNNDNGLGWTGTVGQWRVGAATALSATPATATLHAGSYKLSFTANGASSSVGTATLAGGTQTVSTTAVGASSLIFVSRNTSGGTAGHLSAPVASIVAGTSFVINSSSGTDTSTVNWWIINN